MNRKAERLSDVVSQMVKAAGEAGLNMITDLANHIIVEEVVLVEWEIRTIVNC